MMPDPPVNEAERIKNIIEELNDFFGYYDPEKKEKQQQQDHQDK